MSSHAARDERAAADEPRGRRDRDRERSSLSILRVATDAYPEVMGGGALHVHQLSRMQAEAGHEVTLLTSDHGDRSLSRIEERDGYAVRRHRELARPFGNSITPTLAADLRRLARDHDVVHAHSHLYFSTNVAAALRRVSDTPLVVTNHGLFSQTAPRIVQDAFMATVARFTFDSADRVLCYTEADRDILRARSIRAPISVVDNGIDTDLFTPEAADPPVEDRPLDVLFVGRLKPAKGVQRLLDAFALLADRVPDATLTIVGDGPLADDLRRTAADRGVADRVTLVGQVDNEALPAYYARAAAFALPSDAEGLPRTVLEALACETPVVTSDLPQLGGLVDGVGRTVPRGDVEALAGALHDLLADPGLRRELGARGRRRVVADHSWAETVRRTTAIYDEL